MIKSCILPKEVGWLCWGLTSQSTIFQSCRDGAIASWVINQYFRGVKCLAQGHNTAAEGFEPRTSRSGVRHSTTEPPRSLTEGGLPQWSQMNLIVILKVCNDKHARWVNCTQIPILSAVRLIVLHVLYAVNFLLSLNIRLSFVTQWKLQLYQ